MKQPLVPVACMLAATLLWLLPCTGADSPSVLRTMDAIGTARIYGNNLSVSRENAIQAALMSAIDRVISETYPADSIIANFPAINEILTGKTQQLIQGYRVLTESQNSGYYRVMVQAGVSATEIQKQLAPLNILDASQNAPAVLIMVAEQVASNSNPVFWWSNSETGRMRVEEALSASLSENGFTIVSHGPGSDPVFASVRQSVEPDLSALADLGASLHAEYIVMGKAVAQSSISETGTTVIKGLLKTRVIHPKTGEEIGTSIQTASATHADETAALTEVFRMLGNQAGPDLVSLLKKGAGKTPPKGASMIEITVEGIQHLKYYTLFRKTLSSTPGVKTLIVKEMNQEAAILGVDYQGDPRQLADVLMAKSFKDFSVTARDISAAGMILTIVPIQN